MTVIAAASNSASKLTACFSKDRAPPAVMVIFGAGGDLTKRLVVPALYNLARAGMLSDEFAIVGVDHGGRTTESWIQGLDEILRSFARGAARHRFRPGHVIRFIAGSGAMIRHGHRQ